MKVHTHGHEESALVIILAETREHVLTFDLFKKNLLDIMNADLCLCVARNHREDTANPFYRHARYIWRYEEPDDWGDAFDDLQRRRGLQNDWRKLLELGDQWLGGVRAPDEHPGSAGILLFFRLFLKESIIRHHVLDHYDRFIVTRSDFMHRVPHVPLTLLNPGYIWIPDGEDYGGYTDRHLIAHRSDILPVLSVADRILTEPEALYTEMAHCTNWNLERFIKFSFTSMGLEPKIRRFPYTMYTVRSVGGNTRWRRGDYSGRLGYYIKYYDEYRGYKLASLLIKEHGDWNRFTIILFHVLKRLIESRYGRQILRLFRSVIPRYPEIT
ncbi:MAG: hypothetical protein JXQ27_15065 [Acidobacteria bacterium]|nr:hypothetical protein [Acidobacteriota bacterium]